MSNRPRTAWTVAPETEGATDFSLTCDPDYADAIAALNSTEASAVSVLLGDRLTTAYRPRLVGLLRRRAFRRYLANHVAPAEAAELRAGIDRELGKTKPTDGLSVLCLKLNDCGIGAKKIVGLLAALGLEPAVGDATAKVQRRIDRARRAQVGQTMTGAASTSRHASASAAASAAASAG